VNQEEILIEEEDGDEVVVAMQRIDKVYSDLYLQTCPSFCCRS
jgi:hypothetical protein